MKLTRRQEVFLSGLLDIYHETQAAVHYTMVAQRLGVGKITAYEMLRLLEGRGLVRSEYVLRGRGRGAGRSSVVFGPTQRAESMFIRMAGENWDQMTWNGVEARLLGRLRSTENTHYLQLLEDILTRLSEGRSPMLYAAEMIVAVILSLLQLQGETQLERRVERLRSIRLTGRMALSTLAGLPLGLSFAEDVNCRLMGLLLPHLADYQEIVSQLNGENLRRLSGFAEDVIQVVEQNLEHRAVGLTSG